MQFGEYQKKAAETDYSEVEPITSTKFISILLGLVGEAGEVAEKFKKIYRDKEAVISEEDKLSIKKELGDVLWYITSLGRHVGVDLEDIAISNIEKLADRKKRAALNGSGDNR